MKAQELRQKNVAELNDELKNLVQESFKLKMKHGSGQLAQHHSLRENRRSIARVKTLIHEKQREAS